MNVLIIPASTFPFSPCGPSYVAGAACDVGHTVEVFDCLVAKNPIPELEEHVHRFKRDVMGISIRTVAGKIVDENAEFHTRPLRTGRPLCSDSFANCIEALTSRMLSLCKARGEDGNNSGKVLLLRTRNRVCVPGFREIKVIDS